MSSPAGARRNLESGAGAPLIDDVAKWLANQSLVDAEVSEIFQGCCERLVAAGIALSRGYLGYRTLHPLFASISLVWRRGHTLGTVEHLHEEAFRSEVWLRSPLRYVLERRLPYLRRRLTGRDALLDFQLLEELKAEGATDYLVYRVPFTADESADAPGILGSWATDRRGGFTERSLLDLMRIQRRLAVACKVQIKDQTARHVVDTYLGLDAGRKVLEGQIRRGDSERIHSVLWFSDMRESTRLADLMPAEDFLAVVNAYFECTAGAVLGQGGEVLRFIGDAVLAIFPIDDEPGAAATACRRALLAADDAERRLAELNAQRAGDPPDALDFGLALHVGDVLYGNIGVPERLEFSVVGRAANEVARLERLTKPLGARVLLSEAFAAELPGAYRSLGRHALRGVGEPVEVFARDPSRPR